MFAAAAAGAGRQAAVQPAFYEVSCSYHGWGCSDYQIPSRLGDTLAFMSFPKSKALSFCR